MMRYIIFTIGVSICFSPSLLVAESLDTNKSDSQRAQIAEHIMKLQGSRLDRLLKYAGQPKSDDVFNCLCRATGAGGVGGGVHYKPGYPCEAIGVLGGHSDPIGFPSDPSSLNYCHYDDDSTIVDVVGNALDAIPPPVDEVAGDTLPLERLTVLEKKLLDRNMRYKEACLPTIPKNFEDDSWNLEWGSKVNILNSRREILSKVIDIAESAEDICEEAILVSLYLNSQQGKTKFEIIKDSITPWLPDYITLDYISYTEGKLGAPPIVSTVLNLKSNIELWEQEYRNIQSNAQFTEALNLFNESKNWSTEKQNSYDMKLSNSIEKIENDIRTIKQNMDSRLLHSLPDAKYGPEYYPGTKLENRKFGNEWDDYHEKNDKYVQLKQAEIGILLNKRAGLLIKKKALHDFRKPLGQEGGCEKFLEDRKKACNK